MTAKESINTCCDVHRAGRAISMRPEHLGAEEHYRAMVKSNPTCAEAHFDLGLTLLFKGRWEEAWREYEWRLRWNGYPPALRKFHMPRLRDELKTGMRLLVHADEGHGDTIQFLRFVPLLAGHGIRVYLEVQPSLVCLAELLPGVTQVCVRTDDWAVADFHVPLMSLPFQLGAGDVSKSVRAGYLTVPRSTSSTIPRLDSSPHRRKIGISWAGSPLNPTDRGRSINVVQFERLIQSVDADFYALQQGYIGRQMFAETLVDFTSDNRDSNKTFADAAELISQLDLAIAVDSAIAHLAAAMGRPVWILLAEVTDWRWQQSLRNSAWYSTVVLYRQRRPGDWEEVLLRMQSDLNEKHQRYMPNCFSIE